MADIQRINPAAGPVSAAIPASIEVSPKQAIENADLPGLFPQGTRVYITDVGEDSPQTLASAAVRIAELGYRPVPHFASRRLPSREILETRLSLMTAHAGVTDVLVIGGGLDRPAGEFVSTMQVLETGLFEKYGITHMGIAGHPEGSPDFSGDVALEALRLKKRFAVRSGIELRIVTQFGFDARRFLAWAADTRDAGIDMPIHIGVAGPTSMTTLLRFAAMCGVGNSLGFLKKRASTVMSMMGGFDPEEVVGPVEANWRLPQPLIAQIHVFPFGGVKKSAEWLESRGSWSTEKKIADASPMQVAVNA